MSEPDPDLDAFSKFIGALEPWLGEWLSSEKERTVYIVSTAVRESSGIFR